MHVFIDTNIFLNFYHYSKDQLDLLSNVFSSHANGAAKVYLTQQVCDEFRRNRENKIDDAMKKFKSTTLPVQLPVFIKDYPEYEIIRKLSNDLQAMVKSVSKKVDSDVFEKRLLADQLIAEIINHSEVINTSQEIFNIASMRVSIGNPPGKQESIGDAINWTILLKTVPKGEPLHIISGDGDFYSVLNSNNAKQFLVEEWRQQRTSDLFVYRTLTEFMEEHFDGVAFSYNTEKDKLIDDLATSGSFAATHLLIARLETFSYFSLKEVERILNAAVENGQFGSIITDNDVSDFISRVVIPRTGSVSSPECLAIVEKVIEQQRERAVSNA